MAVKTAIFLSLVFTCLGHARTWTSAEGRTIEGELTGVTETTVTLKRADGRSFTFDLTKLSAADQEFAKGEFAKGKGGTSSSSTAATASAYADMITGDWKQFEGKGNLECMFYGGLALKGEKRYPLVVYLHGKGNQVLNKKELGFAAACARAENQKERPCFILAPQCPNENGWSGAVGANVLKTIKDLMKGLPVDPDRVYLVGYSMGGFGTFELINLEPKLFAAGVPVAGGASAGIARNLRRIPLWIFHGAKDDVVPPEGSRAMAKALEKLHAPVKYTEFPGEGHGIPGKVESDPEVHKWLFAAKRRA